MSWARVRRRGRAPALGFAARARRPSRELVGLARGAAVGRPPAELRLVRGAVFVHPSAKPLVR
eukprot:525027-Pyramimonas_sp.AAC.1